MHLTLINGTLKTAEDTAVTADRCLYRITARQLSPAEYLQVTLLSPLSTRCSSLLVVVSDNDNFVVDDLDECWLGVALVVACVRR